MFTKVDVEIFVHPFVHRIFIPKDVVTSAELKIDKTITITKNKTPQKAGIQIRNSYTVAKN